MVDFPIDIDSDSGSDYPFVRPGTGTVTQLDAELDRMGIRWMRPLVTNYIPIDPIKDVKAQEVQNNWENGAFVRGISPKRHNGLKPLWVKAEIRKKHLGTGETTARERQLSEVIRKRGIKGDQCGHIIACLIGGKMVDINLFPQNKALNCGWKGNHFIWRAVEACVALWVMVIPEKYKPRVEFQMLLYYNNSQHPDRPEKFKYALRFLMDHDSSNDKKDLEDISVVQELLNIEKICLQCTSEEVVKVKKKIKEVIAKVSPKFKKNIEEFLAEWSAIISEIEELVPTEPSTSKPSTSYRHRPRSFWNFVPIIGSVKSITEGIQDIADGYSTSGVLNLVMGGISLGLDIVTIGTISTIVNSIGSTVVKEVAKEVVTETGKTVVKEVGKEIAKETGKAAAKQAASTILMQTGGPVAKAMGTYGASTAARILIKV